MAYGMKVMAIRAARFARGDPGLSLKGIVKGVTGAIKGVSSVVSKVAAPIRSIPGIGPILTKVAPKFIPGLGLISTAATVAGIASKGVRALKAGRTVGGLGSMMSAQQAKGAVMGTALGGLRSTGIAAGGGAIAGAGGAMLAGPGGYGSMQRAIQSGRAAVDPQTGMLVRTGRRYRRMRATNMRALNRSLRRVKAFAKIARQVLVTEKRFKVKKGSRGRK